MFKFRFIMFFVSVFLAASFISIFSNSITHLSASSNKNRDLLDLRNFTEMSPTGIFQRAAETVHSRLPDFEIPGCTDVTTTVFYTWSCPSHPGSKPEVCKAEKLSLEKTGKCRDNLAIVGDDLFATGKTNPTIYHRQYTGMQVSGPFTELKDSKGKLWWVQTYHWTTALKKINPEK